MSQPLVSVLMPVYNAGKDLAEAIQSILDQTYTNFEFIIVNDGSTDASRDVISNFNDSRIHLIDNEVNKGLIATLNLGIDACKGEYIVRMDADDISLPERIEHQIAFLEAHSHYGLVGCWFEDFGDQIQSKVVRYSDDDTYIRIRHLYQTHIAHPTAVWRASIIRAHQLKFDPAFVHGEDYEFWVRMSAYCKMSNVKEVLVRKRDHPHNVTNKYAQIMQDTCARVKQRQFSLMGINCSTDEVNLYSRFADGEWRFSPPQMDHLETLLESIFKANKHSKFIPVEAYNRYLAEKYYHLCYNNPDISKEGWKRFRKSSFSRLFKGKFQDNLKFRIKTLLR
ncbi:MAG TPA: glycosyltransferase family A protein [Flavobacteriales bacterium]|nr:glycosyltransferase family A protein [Flavobacteriales bacterium]HPH80994.1 glycosyltransferase family A protein [Flavobacteriales bacterium]